MKKEDKIGALWIKAGNNGEFWTGNIDMQDGTKQNVIIFKNGFKENNQPDLIIYKQQPKIEEQEEFTISNEEDLPF